MILKTYIQVTRHMSCEKNKYFCLQKLLYEVNWGPQGGRVESRGASCSMQRNFHGREGIWAFIRNHLSILNSLSPSHLYLELERKVGAKQYSGKVFKQHSTGRIRAGQGMVNELGMMEKSSQGHTSTSLMQRSLSQDDVGARKEKS